MTPKIYMKKPEFIEAQQFLNDANSNSLLNWINTSLLTGAKFKSGGHSELVNEVLLIPTLHGYYIARISDWVIRDAQGNFLVYTDDTFNKLFEEVKLYS
jgi:hypothetical protein